jgi:hypothetical protein
MSTLQELSSPNDDAGELELAFGSMAMMLERALPGALEEMQDAGELDDIVLKLSRWFAAHRGDESHQLVVVELPRRETGNGIMLARLQDAIASGGQTGVPL